MQQRSDVRELDLALLFADLSGYTALTEIHGALTASGIVLQFCRLAQASLEPGVQFINSIGDDVFCAGKDTLAVIRSALKLRNAAENEPYFPRIRMGIHRGPIIEREGRLFGAPINLTSRLADQAQGGQILCSAPIAEAVRVLAEIEARPAGERHFKNIARPVHVFELARMASVQASSVIDPVCRMQVDISRVIATVEHTGSVYYFCSAECARVFRESPDLYIDLLH
jgi:class 3 adenylate cyclase